MNNNTVNILKLAAFFALIIIILIAIYFLQPNSQLFQGLIAPPIAIENTSICKSLTLDTIPSPVPATQGAIVIIKTLPAEWEGQFSVSTTDGSFSDSKGQTGSLISTNERVITFSGGESETAITVQAMGSGNEQCLNSLSINDNSFTKCDKLTIFSFPTPLTENESGEITITTTPPEWSGSFLFTADSGKFQLSGADQKAMGNNTKTLITSLKKVIYNGGKTNENITVTALNEGNEQCTSTLTIQ